MAIQNEDPEESDNEVSDSCTFDELRNAFYDLSEEIGKLGARCVSLKKNFAKLEEKVKVLENEKNASIDEKSLLKHEVEKFSNIALS